MVERPETFSKGLAKADQPTSSINNRDVSEHAYFSLNEWIRPDVLSDFRQRTYAHRILSLPNSIPTKDILPITLREGDGNAQPEDLPEGDSIWSNTQRIRTYGQHLARQISVGFCIDPAEGVEPIVAIPPQVFPGKVFMEDRNGTIRMANEELADLTLRFGVTGLS